MSRASDLPEFYRLLDSLADRTGGPIPLHECLANSVPERGVYFFFEPGEERRESGRGLRVVRVGTHALTAGSSSTLKQRLRQHRGSRVGSGNHRGSIFRLLVGQALQARSGDLRCETWGLGQNAGALAADLRSVERVIELEVSNYLARMKVLLLPILDDPGPASARAKVEAGAIALLSNHNRKLLDEASLQWLGHFSNRPLVRSSGLWNQRHVEAQPDPELLELLDQLVHRA